MSLQWPNLGLYGEFTCDEDALALINSNFKTLDALAQIAVTSQIGALPATGSTGEKVILASTGEIYVFTDQWENLGVQTGYIAYDESLGSLIYYDGTQWVEVGGSTDAAPATTTVVGVAPGIPGQLVYHTGTTWALADHSNIDTVAIAMIVEVGAGEYKVQTSGPVTLTGHGYTVGDYYFGDAATPGAATDVKPSADGEIQKSVFHVNDADTLELLLQSEPSIVEVEDPQVNAPYRPASVYKATAGQAVPEASEVLIIWDTDVDTSPAVTKNAAGTIFTINEAANYTVDAHFLLAFATNMGQTTQTEIKVFVNGSLFVGEADANAGVAGTNQAGIQNASLGFTKFLNVGDTLEFYARNSNSTDLDRQIIATNTWNYVSIAKDNS